jgi:hypothetical protein
MKLDTETDTLRTSGLRRIHGRVQTGENECSLLDDAAKSQTTADVLADETHAQSSEEMCNLVSGPGDVLAAAEVMRLLPVEQVLEPSSKFDSGRKKRRRLQSSTDRTTVSIALEVKRDGYIKCD